MSVGPRNFTQYPSKASINFTLFWIAVWIGTAFVAFHQAAAEEKASTPKATPHTSIWIEPPVVTPAPTPVPPNSGNYPRPAQMPAEIVYLAPSARGQHDRN
jgi:hypothetical protein